MDFVLGAHSLIRWLILAFLVINIVRSFVESDSEYSPADIQWNLRLLIVAHINLLIGFVQYFFGSKGFAFFRDFSFGEIMRDPFKRFWAVEHIAGMIIAVAIITISRSVTKKDWPDGKKHKRQMLLYTLALVIILAVIPWPFRGLGAPWFRSLY